MKPKSALYSDIDYRKDLRDYLRRTNIIPSKLNKMKYTLHKLKEGFIITSDEKTKYGDFVWNGEHILEVAKVFHPIGQKVIAQEDQIDFSALSEEEQKEIGWFDYDRDLVFHSDWNLLVEKLSQDFTQEWCGKRKVDTYIHDAYIAGFQKAQELLSDRMFTLDKVFKMIELSRERFFNTNSQKEQFKYKPGEVVYIVSNPPKSWEIEGEWENDIFKITKIL